MIDIQISGIEWRVQKYIFTFMVNWFLMRVPKNKTHEGKWSFQPMLLRKVDIHMQKKAVVPGLTLCKKIILKWIMQRNIRAKTINLLEENIGVYLHHTGLGNGFFGVKALMTKNKSWMKWTWSKWKFASRTPTRKWKGSPQNGRK